MVLCEGFYHYTLEKLKSLVLNEHGSPKCTGLLEDTWDFNYIWGLGLLNYALQ